MLINFIFLTKNNSGNMRKRNDLNNFLSTQCFTVYKQDLGKASQSECFSDSVVLQRADQTQHVQLSMCWYLLCSHRGTGVLIRMPQPASAAATSKAGNEAGSLQKGSDLLV